MIKYFIQVSVLQPNRSSFFVSYVKPHNCVSSKTLSRWILTLLSSSGIDTSTFKAHSRRSAAGVLLQKSMSYVQICKLADWSMKSGVFERFYLRYLWIYCEENYSSFVILSGPKAINWYYLCTFHAFILEKVRLSSLIYC